MPSCPLPPRSIVMSTESKTASCGLAHPEWYKVAFKGGKERLAMRSLLRDSKLHSVCESARCPNLCDCWKRQTATFMILGEQCTRNCRFCAVNHGKPAAPDPDEPQRIAEAVATLKLRYVVITCVTRDDLPDGGAAMMAACIRAVRQKSPDCKVEVLCSDYAGSKTALQLVLQEKPQVFAHNLETVRRLSASIRPQADYERSLQVLANAAQWARHSEGLPKIKSGLMLGLGESEQELRQCLADLRDSGVQILTLGQYLQPSHEQVPVQRHISPEEFEGWKNCAEKEFGFHMAVAGPLIRSSYLAEEAYLAVK